MASIGVDDVSLAHLSTYSARTPRTSANQFVTLALAGALVFGPTDTPEAQDAVPQSRVNTNTNENAVGQIADQKFG